MSDALAVLQPFITDRVNELVRRRLLEGLKFFDGHSLKPEFNRAEAKLTILVVRLANPREFLSEDERALIEATSRQMQSGAQNGTPAKAKENNVPHLAARKPKRQKPGL